MRRSLLALALAIVTIPAAALAQPRVVVEPTSFAGDEALAALRAEYAAAASAGDAGRLSALYAPDAIAVLRDGLMLRGRAEIERYSQTAFNEVPAGATVTLTPKQFETRGHMASETGTFVETAGVDGQPAATGVYVAIYARDADGRWRIAMEVRSRGRDQQVVRW